MWFKYYNGPECDIMLTWVPTVIIHFRYRTFFPTKTGKGKIWMHTYTRFGKVNVGDVLERLALLTSKLHFSIITNFYFEQINIGLNGKSKSNSKM